MRWDRELYFSLIGHASPSSYNEVLSCVSALFQNKVWVYMSRCSVKITLFWDVLALYLELIYSYLLHSISTLRLTRHTGWLFFSFLVLLSSNVAVVRKHFIFSAAAAAAEILSLRLRRNFLVEILTLMLRLNFLAEIPSITLSLKNVKVE